MTTKVSGSERRRTWPCTVTVGSVSVKIYRATCATNASGESYTLAFTTPAGRKLRKFADPEKAIDEARIVASQLAHGRVEATDMTSSDRDELQAVRRAAKGTPILAILAEWTKARELTGGNILPAAEAWAARNSRTLERIKVADVVKKFLAAKKAVGRDHAGNQSTYDRITADFGQSYIDSISARHIETWLENWENGVTKNTYRKRLLSVWKWAQKKGFLPREIQNEVQLTDTAREDPSEIGIINVATWTKLLARFHATHPELLPALVLAGFAGLRRKEIHAQLWDDVALERNSLHVTSAKKGTPSRRLVPLGPAAVEWLLLCKQRKGPICPLVAVNGEFQPALAIDGIRRIARKAGIELPENAFRHSYISHAVAATGDIPRVSLDAGNSPDEVNKHYRQLVSERDGKAWFDVRPGNAAKIVAIRGGAS